MPVNFLGGFFSGFKIYVAEVKFCDPTLCFLLQSQDLGSFCGLCFFFSNH